MAATGKTSTRRVWGAGPVKPGWLFVITEAVLISPYPHRDGGPTGAEADSILAMQHSLQAEAVTVWVDPETGLAEAHTMAMDVLQAEASRLATVRMKRYRSAA
jgi:hypothetical protein